jgi:hypothetical protein
MCRHALSHKRIVTISNSSTGNYEYQPLNENVSTTTTTTTTTTTKHETYIHNIHNIHTFHEVRVKDPFIKKIGRLVH